MNSAFRVALRQFSTAQTTRAGGNVPAGKNRFCNVLCFQGWFIIVENLLATLSFSGYQQIKQKQKMWSVDNGLRVHQRGGMGDAILYNTCLGLIVIGGYLWVDTVYTLAFPKK